MGRAGGHGPFRWNIGAPESQRMTAFRIFSRRRPLPNLSRQLPSRMAARSSGPHEGEVAKFIEDDEILQTRSSITRSCRLAWRSASSLSTRPRAIAVARWASPVPLSRPRNTVAEQDTDVRKLVSRARGVSGIRAVRCQGRIAALPNALQIAICRSLGIFPVLRLCPHRRTR